MANAPSKVLLSIAKRHFHAFPAGTLEELKQIILNYPNTSVSKLTVSLAKRDFNAMPFGVLTELENITLNHPNNV